jgi:thiol-disulfide isomerase/thioredoxin
MTMRRLLYIALVAGLCGLGCNSTGKKPPAKTAPQSKGRDDSPFWADGSDPKPAPGTATTPIDGMLAGMLIDNSGRPVPNAVVNVTTAGAGPDAKPIGIQSDEQGIFTIKGLKTGTTYFLSARLDATGHVLGGSAVTQASNTRMLIKLSEGAAAPVTPPAQPGAPTEKKEAKTKLVDPPGTSVPSPDPIPKGKDPLIDGMDQSWAPGKVPPTTRPVVVPPPTPAQANPNVAEANNRFMPPPASIPGSAPKVEPPPPPATPRMSATPSNSSPLVAAPNAVQDKRTNFTVYDLACEAVEFRNLTDRRLIVLDFWSTSCLPCLRKIPDLIDLQARYGDYVAVAGIACDDLPWPQRKKAVEGIKDYYLRKAQRPINYGLYLEGERQEGRIQQQFNVRAYPTLVLVEHGGRELWRGHDVRQLEDAIKFYLQRR